jgi:hypothetical protein
MKVTIERHGVQFVASDGKRAVEGDSVSDAALRLEAYHELPASDAEELNDQATRLRQVEKVEASILRLLQFVHSEKVAPITLLNNEIDLLRRHLTALNDVKERFCDR